MTTNTTIRTQADAGYETSKFAMAVGFSMAALVALCSVASLVSALVNNGPVSLVKSYFLAVTGI